jgi:hypothetical protein
MASAETWLSIDDQTTRLDPVVLNVGRQNTGLRQDPPTPLEIETAIAAVEDEIQRVHARIARGARLYTRDAAVRELALDAGVAPGAEMALAVEAVEQAFNRLPQRAMGREKAATLLILRELMHHLGFEAIVVRPR